MQNQGFAGSYTAFVSFLFHPLHRNPSTLSPVRHLSVIVCLLGLSGMICKNQEKVISETPALLSRVFNFQLVL